MPSTSRGWSTTGPGPGRSAGERGGVEAGRAHIDAGSADGAVLAEELEREHTGKRLNGDRLDVGGDHALFDGVLREAADAVPAHLRLGAVGVEHAHTQVGHVGGEGEDEAVAADPEVAITDLASDGGPVPFRLGADVDVVVAESVHLGHAHVGECTTDGVDGRMGYHGEYDADNRHDRR